MRKQYHSDKTNSHHNSSIKANGEDQFSIHKNESGNTFYLFKYDSINTLCGHVVKPTKKA